MSVIIATAYMEEAERFDWLIAMDAGKVLAAGLSGRHQGGRRGATTIEEAFIALLPEPRRPDKARSAFPPRRPDDQRDRSSQPGI